MIYLTGDTHRNFKRIEKFCKDFNTTKDDIMIILGDAGINYCYNKKLNNLFNEEIDNEEIDYDYELKTILSKLPITLFCIHGNHEQRPENIPTYKYKSWNNGLVMVEDEFPNLIFACDAQIYKLNELNTLVIGGAYSADKYHRLKYNVGWWPDEQPSDNIKQNTEQIINEYKYTTDIVLTHTCPLKYEPHEAYLSFINQNTVDKSTEIWLDEIENKLNYKKWYCGHWHINKTIDKMQFLFDGYEMFPNKKSFIK